MNQGFRLFPESASTYSDEVDALYTYLIIVAVFFTLLIAALILYFAIRYRRGSAASRENPPVSNWLEISWTVIPLLINLSMFAWGAHLYMRMLTPPAQTVEINVVGKQWMWKVQHSDGRAEINELHLPLGQAVRLRMISEDVIHSFFIPAFRIKQDVLPGYYTGMWFQPTQTGEYHLFCAEYCGTEHSRMRGRVVVMEPEAFATWLSGESGGTPQQRGAALFDQMKCATCHKQDGTGPCPSLVGVFGSRVPLQGGGTVLADESYIRTSILDPPRQVVAGFKPIMPSFRGQLDETQILQLIAYIKSLTATKAAAPDEPEQ